MPRRKQTDNVKLMVYMPRRLYRRLRVALARSDGGTRSAYISAAVEKSLNGGDCTAGKSGTDEKAQDNG